VEVPQCCTSSTLQYCPSLQLHWKWHPSNKHKYLGCSCYVQNQASFCQAWNNRSYESKRIIW